MTHSDKPSTLEAEHEALKAMFSDKTQEETYRASVVDSDDC